MAGYVRVSASDIMTGQDVKAGPLNAEYNAIKDAFAVATGHKHDGSTGEGPKINLVTSLSGYLPAVHGGSGGKNNFGGTTVPITTDDSSQGYAIGSIWYNTSTGKLYVCTTNTASNAIWKEFSLGTSAGSTTLQDLSVTGTTTLYGNTNLGNANSDIVTVVATTTFENNTTFGTANTDTMSIIATPTFTPQIIANGGVAGALTGNVTGDVTGNISSSGTSSLNNVTLNGAITGGTIENSAIGGVTASTITGTIVTANTNFSGNITGDVTGNVSASTGISVFHDVRIDGQLNMNAATGTTNTIINLTTPTNDYDAATKKYVDDAKASILGSVTTEFDTLQEIEALIGDDALVSGDLVTMIGTKLSKAGGTMTANIVMSNSAEITGLPNSPTSGSHATSKTYVDGILGSATAASASATAAQNAQGLAESARDASIVAKDASETALTTFQNIYHSPNASDPSGLSSSDYGDLFFNTNTQELKVYKSGGWTAIGVDNATSNRFSYLANTTGSQTEFTGADEAGNTLAFTSPFIDVYKNGVRQSLQNADYALSGGNKVTFPSALAANDVVEMVTWNAFEVSNLTNYLQLSGGTINGDLILTGANANIQWDKSDDALEILDNAKITLGTTTAMEISSTGISSDSLSLKSITSSHNFFTGTQGAETKVYHNNNPHIETNANGAVITGSGQNTIATLSIGTGSGHSAGIGSTATNLNIIGPANHQGFTVDNVGVSKMQYQGGDRVHATSTGTKLNGTIEIEQATIGGNAKGNIRETAHDLVNEVSSFNLNWDVTKASVYYLDLTTANINSMTISGHENSATSAYAQGFTVRVKQPASGNLPIVNWDSNIKWVGGNNPTLTSTNGAVDVISFFTMRGDIYGFVSGLDVK